MVAGITLPLACAATCMASINVQRMSVQAAVTGDVELLKLAVLHDPLVGAIASPDEVWQMVDEMLVAAGALAAAIRPRHRGCQAAAEPQERRHKGLAGRRAPRRAPGRDRPPRKGRERGGSGSREAGGATLT